MTCADALAAAVSEVVDDFLAESGWDGEMHDLSRWWVAPPAWRGLAALGGVQYARFAFALTPVADGHSDHHVIAALTGAGRQRGVLRWEREPAGSAVRFARFVGKHRDMKAQIAALGFVRYHHLGPSFHLPLVIGARVTDARRPPTRGEASARVAAALRVAHAAAPALKPLVKWTVDQLER